MEIVCRQNVFLRTESKFVGGSMTETFFDTRTCKPACESKWIVVAAKRACLKHWHAAKFGRKDDQSRVQKSTLFQVLKQPCDWLVKDVAVDVVL